MIGYLKGTITHLVTDHCFIDVQGVGYRVFIPGATRQKLSIGKVSSLFTHMHVREDAILLYGFYTEDEYDLFLTLTSINGIGPKVAMGFYLLLIPNNFVWRLVQKILAC